MSVPAPPSQHRPARGLRASTAVPLAVLVVSAAAAGAAIAAAPATARTWTVAAALAAWLGVALTVVVSALLVGRSGRAAAAREAETVRLRAQLAQLVAESAHVANVTLPSVAKRLRDGVSTSEALTSVPMPSEPQLRLILDTFAAVVEQDVRHAAALDAERQQAHRELAEGAAELERLTKETLPTAVARLRDGHSSDTVLAELEWWPRSPLLRGPAESFLRELAHSERRAAAAQAASAKALSRVQAKAVSMLADLREMQEQHGEEVFGDLLRLDHSTSQLGLMTDRLALLMGGRASRAWNKPIVMESILRGAVGRIAAYRRVRLHCSTNAAISGFAAEGVMHLLAELTDNAANFSPPIDEVHVYVEERSAGVVVTIEDSGLKMADAAMRHAEEAVAGRMTDLASLQGTRLGLAVVGRLAVKYGISVNYRPSSRGGTGVVVLLPPQLLAQRREPAPRETLSGSAGAVPVPREDAGRTPVTEPRPAERAGRTAVTGAPSGDSTRRGSAAEPARRVSPLRSPVTESAPRESAHGSSAGEPAPWETTGRSSTAEPPTPGVSGTAQPAPGTAHAGTPSSETAGTAETVPGTARTPETTYAATFGSETARTRETTPGTTHATDPAFGSASDVRGGATPRSDAGARTDAEAEHPEQDAHRRPAGATVNGLPVRAPGRTMAEAERERRQRRATAEAPRQDESRSGGRSATRDVGARFGAFHRGRRSGSSAGGSGAGRGPETRTAPEAPAERTARAEPGARTGAEIRLDPGTRHEFEAHPEPDTRPESDTGPEPGARPERDARPEARTGTTPDALTEPGAHAESAARPATTARTEPGARPEARAGTRPDALTEPGARAESEMRLETTARTERGVRPESEVQPSPDARPHPPARPESEPPAVS